MPDSYPIVFEAKPEADRQPAADGLPGPWPFPWSVWHPSAQGLPLPWPFPWSVSHPAAAPVPWPWPFVLTNGPSTGSGNGFTVELEALAGQECHEFVLAQIKGWPETKVEYDLRCVTVFHHKVCTKVPVVYHRSCTLEVVVNVCYPTGCLNDVVTCVTGAGMAAAVAAVISGGTAAAGAFKAALEACLLAKGAKWANEVTVNVPAPKTVCGPWHPV